MEWISVNDRLPALDADSCMDDAASVLVLVFDEDAGQVLISFLCAEGWRDTCIPVSLTGVTHWMPLPKPPGVEAVSCA